MVAISVPVCLLASYENVFVLLNQKRSTGNWKRFLQWPSRVCPANLYAQIVAVTRMRTYINPRRDYTVAEESNGPEIGSKIFDDDAIEIARARQKDFLS